MCVVTFYSYKGGVGRTLALLNVVYELVNSGQKVLVADFDLEAPAIHSDHWRWRTNGNSMTAADSNYDHAGIVEFVSEHLETMRGPSAEEYIVDTTPERCRGTMGSNTSGCSGREPQ